GAEIANPQGVIVVVGPNSSGKTLFLKDIENYLLTGKSGWVVCEGLAATRPEAFRPFVEELIARNYLQPIPNQGNQCRTNVPFLVQTAPNQPRDRQPFQLTELEKAFNGFVTDKNGNNPEWFGRIGMVLVAPL